MSNAHKELATIAADIILSGEANRVWILSEWWDLLSSVVERAMASEPNVSTRRPEYTKQLVFVEPFTTRRRQRKDMWVGVLGPKWGDPTDTELIPQSQPAWRIAVCAYMPDSAKHGWARMDPAAWAILRLK